MIIGASARRRGVRLPIAWDELPLGEEHDAVLARRLGVSKSIIQRKRVERGIEPLGRPRNARRQLAHILWAKRCWWTLSELSAVTGYHRVVLGSIARELREEGLVLIAGGGRTRGPTVRVMWNPELAVPRASAGASPEPTEEEMAALDARLRRARRRW